MDVWAGLGGPWSRIDHKLRQWKWCECSACDDRAVHRAAEKIAGDKIVTHFWAKPIPPREFDWCAYRDNDEPDDDGHMIQGWGRTEQDAIDDLIALIEDSRS